MFTYNDMDAVFHALAHESRRKILDLVKDRPGQSVGELAGAFDVSRIAVMNHLAVLEKAGLITSEKQGRTRRLYLNATPIQMIHERWLDVYNTYWSDQLLSIKHAAEAVVNKQERKE